MLQNQLIQRPDILRYSVYWLLRSKTWEAAGFNKQKSDKMTWEYMSSARLQVMGLWQNNSGLEKSVAHEELLTTTSVL